MANEDLLVGKCPNCGYALRYDPNANSVECNACDSWVNVSDLKEPNRNVASPLMVNSSYSGVVASDLVAKIDNTGAILAYLDNFFENYSWEEYIYQTTIEIEDVRSFVDNSKIKFANDPSIWGLEFKSYLVPVTKKIEGLSTISKNIASLYFENDGTEAYPEYDIYTRVIKSLLASKERIIKILELDINNAKKYGGSDDLVNSLNDQLAELKTSFESIVVSEAITDTPDLQKIINERNEKLEQKYAERGIDVKALYKSAVAQYGFSDDKSSCLTLFKRIADYKDSKSYINKINSYFNFNGQLYVIAGRTFTFGDFKKKVNTYQKKSVKEMVGGLDNSVEEKVGLDLYEVIDGEITLEPMIESVLYVICVYGENLYVELYDNKAKEYQLVAFNINDKTKEVLDRCSNSKDLLYLDMDGTSSFWFTMDKTKFFIKKKLIHKIDDTLVKSGCGAKPVATKNLMYNNFSVILVDMEANEASTIIDATVDIHEVYQDKIFYSYSYSEVKDDIITKFYVYDINSNSKDEVLDENCIIHAVNKDRIVYTTFNQSCTAENVDLHVYDMISDSDRLIESNVYEFFDIINNKIYYTVGNAEYSSLLSVNFDGTERTEILANVENIFAVQAGWMYVTKGRGYNKALIKISTDGKRRVTLCTLFKKVVKIANGNLYYIDIYDNLCTVRIDGKNNRIIARNLDPNSKVIVDSERLYYAQKELKEFNDNNKPIYTKSLYSLDLNGHNIVKHEFAIEDFKNYDENNIYIHKKETVSVKVGTPDKKGHYQYTVKDYNITKYVLFNKVTDAHDLVLTLGLPTKKAVENPGCLGFGKKTIDYTYEIIPVKYIRKRTDIATQGEAYNEQASSNIEKPQTKNNNGCSSNGCSSLGSGCAPKK